jgi:hypothetical protein
MEYCCSDSQQQQKQVLRKTHAGLTTSNTRLTRGLEIASAKRPAQHEMPQSKLYFYAEHTNTISIFLSHASQIGISNPALRTKFVSCPSFRNNRIAPAKTQPKNHKLPEQSFTE